MNNPIRILLVDDNPYFLEAAREFLALQEAFTVVDVATEEQEALAKSIEGDLDVILLDLNLAHRSGLELIPLFRKQLPQTKIIVLTMMQEAGYRAAALQAGADAFVSKTAMSKSLVSTIMEIMDRKSSVVDDVPAHSNFNQDEARFLRLAEHLPDLIYRYEFAPRRGFTYVSPSATAMTGYTPEEHYADPDLGYKLVHPDDLHLLQAVAEGQADMREPLVLRWVRKDGTVFWTEQRNVPIFDANGNLIACEGVARDITERKQAEADLAYQADLLANISDAVVSTDANMIIRSWNKAAERMFGYTAEEMIGKSAGEVLAAEYPNTTREAVFKQLMETGQWQGEVRLRHKDGRIVYATAAGTMLRDSNGVVTGFLSVNHDNTEHKYAEQALEQSQAQLQGIISSAMDALITIDEDQRILLFNPAAERMYRCPASEAIGQSLSRFMPEHIRAEHGRFVQEFGLSSSSKRSMESPFLELMCLRADGETFLSEVSISQLELGGRKLYTAIVRDITERKQAETAVLASEDRYRDLVEHIHDLIGTHDLQGNILSINPAASRLLGVDTATLQKMNLRDMLAPEARDQFDEYLAVIQRDGQAAGVMLVQTASGEKRIWEYDNTLRTDTLGEPVVRAMASDITERRQAEEALQESEARYRAIFDGVQDAIFVETFDGRILAVNQSACEIYGYSRAEFPTRTVNDLVPEGYVLLAADNGPLSKPMETVNRRANGEIFPVEINGRLATISGETVLLVVVREITERKQIENAMRARDEILHESQKVARLGHYRFDVSSQTWERSDTLNEVFGIDEKYVTDINGWVNLVHPAQREEMLEYFTDHVIKNHNPFDREYRIIRDNDKWERWVHGLGKLEFDAGGNLIRMIGTIQDITERKHAEQETLRHLVELEALHENGLAISRLLDPCEIGNRVIETIERYLDWHHVTVRLRRPESDELELVAFQLPGLKAEERAEAEKYLNSLINKVGQGMSGWVVQTGAPVRIGNLNEDPRFLNLFEGMQSGLYMPLKAGDSVIGVISVESEITDAFTAQDERLLATLANQVAVALENARLFQDLQRELSERQSMNEALWTSEERYRLLLEQLPAIVYTDETNTTQPRTVFISPRIRDILGYSPEEWLAGGYEMWTRSIHPDDVDHVTQHYHDSIEHGSTYTHEYRMFRRDGSMIWVRDSAAIQRDEHGKALNMQGVLYDITDSRNSENTLRLQSAALEAADNAMILTDVDGNIQWVNAAFTRLTGYESVEVIGKNPRILSSGTQDETFYKNLWDTILSGRVWHGELVNKRKDGSLYHEEQTVTPLLDPAGVITHFINIKQDITRRKQTEEKIRQQVEHLSALRDIDQAIASSFDMRVSLKVILIKTLNLLKVDAAAILLLNPGMGLLEYADGQGFRTRLHETASIKVNESYAGWAVLNRSMVAFDNLAREPENKFMTGFFKEEKFVGYRCLPLLVKGQVVGVMEIFHRSVVRRDETWVDFFGALAGQAAIAVDNAQLFSAFQRELMERKMVEERLRDSHTELEKRIEERTSDMQQVNFELERALRVKDEFLANMSHELRTPLNAVIGLSDSLAEQIAGPLNDKQEKYVSTIRESGHHLLDLINDILDLAKIEAGQVTLSQDTVNIAAVCQSSLRMVKQLALKKNQEVSLELDADLDTIRADERRLKQMIVNLLSNAVKFTPEKGKLGLQVRGDRENNVVRFTVWDTGIGIEEKDLSHLFKPFSQLDSNLARKSSGTGLGLALVAKMASMHGGGVSVESEPGVGSQFTITLPWESFQAVGSLSTYSTGKLQITKPLDINKNYTILLVDDTEEVVLLLRDYLEYAGFKVVVARTGLESIAQAEKITPSLILMDIQMPVMDGLEATRRIRAIDALEHTPIIALTALAMKGDRERCLAAGMNEYISKPVNLRALMSMIQNQLSHGKEAERL